MSTDCETKSSLEIYDKMGFKFFSCKADRRPECENWRAPENQLSRTQAEQLQTIGQNIGAWIPENVVVIDLDRHEGRPSGLEEIKEIKQRYDIQMSFLEETFSVRTAGRGIHIFFTTNKTFRQNEKAPGIKLKTSKGYVIAAGSPGYQSLNDFDPAPLPLQLEMWLDDCETKNAVVSNGKKSELVTDENGNDWEHTEKARKFVSASLMKKILEKIPVEHFRSNDRWLKFVMSALAAGGVKEDIKTLVHEWSASDSQYAEHKNIYKRIESFKEIEKITLGTFIHFLREEDLSPALISKVAKLDGIGAALVEAERGEENLLIDEPNYSELAQTQDAIEFFTSQGNTAAASILDMALSGKVLYCSGEKQAYYFDGNKWVELNNHYGMVYTILLRVLKIVFGNQSENEENEALTLKCILKINDTFWKDSTWRELIRRETIFRKSVAWDGVQNKETLTLNDGVLDFSGKQAIKRNGIQNEYRKHFIDLSCDEILQAPEPLKFKKFLDGIFPDKDTLRTLEYYISCMISGNASKRIFSIWKGSGANGKSTLSEIINDVLGSDLYTIFNVGLILQSKDSEGLGVTPEMAKLQGSRCAVTSEVDHNHRLNVSKIKNLCGDETITANPKHRDPISFQSTWQMVLMCNDFPRFNGSDNALIDRLLVLPFDMKYIKNPSELEEWVRKGVKRKFIKPAEDKKTFVPSVSIERAGILKFMIDKYIELENDLKGVIPESEECKKLKGRYVKDNDDFGLFIDRFCVIDTEADFFTTNQRLTDLYRDFMDNKKLSVQYVTQGIIKATNEVVEKTVKRVAVKNEHGFEEIKQQRGLCHIRIDENKINADEDEVMEIPF